MFKKIVAAAALAMLAGPSFAQSSTRPSDPIYVGLDAGSTRVDGLDGRKASLGAFVGYTFNENYAVEAAYRHLGSWTVSNVDLKVTQTALSLLTIFPLNPQFDIFARVGFNRVSADASYQAINVNISNNGSFYGFGAGYNFATNMAARIEVQKPSKDSINLNLAVIYRF